MLLKIYYKLLRHVNINQDHLMCNICAPKMGITRLNEEQKNQHDLNILAHALVLLALRVAHRDPFQISDTRNCRRTHWCCCEVTPFVQIYYSRALGK